MQTFMLGIIISLATEFVIFLIIRFINNKKLKYFLAKSLLKNEYIPYENQSAAIDNIRRDMSRSSQVRILAIRGLSYISNEGDFNFIWDNPNKRIEIILSEQNNDAVYMRSKLYLENNDDYIKEMTMIHNALFSKHKLCPNLTFFTHNVDLTFRLIIFDKYLYLSFFNDGKKASESQMYKYDRDSQMYRAFYKYYKNVRRKSKKQFQ